MHRVGSIRDTMYTGFCFSFASTLHSSLLFRVAPATQIVEHKNSMTVFRNFFANKIGGKDVLYFAVRLISFKYCSREENPNEFYLSNETIAF